MATMASTLSRTLACADAEAGRPAETGRGAAPLGVGAETFTLAPPLGGVGGAGAFAAGPAGAGAAGAAVGAAAGGAAFAAVGAPAGMAGNLMVGDAAGFGGSEIRTVSFLGATLGASDGRGGTLGFSSDIVMCGNARIHPLGCQTHNPRILNQLWSRRLFQMHQRVAAVRPIAPDLRAMATARPVAGFRREGITFTAPT